MGLRQRKRKVPSISYPRMLGERRTREWEYGKVYFISVTAQLSLTWELWQYTNVFAPETKQKRYIFGEQHWCFCPAFATAGFWPASDTATAGEEGWCLISLVTQGLNPLLQPCTPVHYTSYSLVPPMTCWSHIGFNAAWLSSNIAFRIMQEEGMRVSQEGLISKTWSSITGELRR